MKQKAVPQAISKIIRTLGLGVSVEIEDVLRNEPASWRKWQRDSWSELLEDGATSVVVAGSSLANPAAEIVTVAMLDGASTRVVPFQSGSTTIGRVPFHFIWPDRVKPPFESSFTLRPIDIKDEFPAQWKEIDAGSRGIRIQCRENGHDGAKMFVTGTAKGSRRTYALIVAQQRSGNQQHRATPGPVLMTLAGATGPATLAAARFLVTEITHSLPQPKASGKHGKVLWGIVEADELDGPRGDIIDSRRIGEPRLATPLFEWPT